jgi:hypothetical protein
MNTSQWPIVRHKCKGGVIYAASFDARRCEDGQQTRCPLCLGVFTYRKKGEVRREGYGDRMELEERCRR